MTAKLFYFPSCPYCVKAKRAIEELKEENPEYQKIEIEWVNEHKDAALADQYDYYYVPTIFYGEEKLYEASPAHSYEDIKENIRRAFQTICNTMFSGKIAVVTGASRGIGKCISDEFRKNGVVVCTISRTPGGFFTGDLAKKEVLEAFAGSVIEKYGHVDYLINNALPLMKGIDTCTYEEFQYALAVGVSAPFYLAKLFAPYFAEGASIVNISSSRDRMSQPQTESYTAAKGGIAALTHALAVSFAGKVRVNSISPGWIDTNGVVYEGPDAVQQPAGRVGNPMDIANMVLYLCSDKAGFITGENICIDGGMTKQMIYHGDNGWTLSLS